MNNEYKNELIEHIQKFCDTIGDDTVWTCRMFKFVNAKILHNPSDINGVQESTLEWMIEKFKTISGEIDIQLHRSFNDTDPHLIFDIDNDHILFYGQRFCDGQQFNIKWEAECVPTFWITECEKKS